MLPFAPLWAGRCLNQLSRLPAIDDTDLVMPTVFMWRFASFKREIFILGFSDPEMPSFEFCGELRGLWPASVWVNGYGTLLDNGGYGRKLEKPSWRYLSVMGLDLMRDTH